MIDIFEERIHNQYALVAIAAAIVVLIKWFMVRRAYHKKLDSFIHPQTVLPELKVKVKSVDEAQQLIAYNFFKVLEDYSRLRNIAFLVAYLKEYGAPVAGLKGKMQETFAKLESQKMVKGNQLYRDYIRQQIQKDVATQQSTKTLQRKKQRK